MGNQGNLYGIFLIDFKESFLVLVFKYQETIFFIFLYPLYFLHKLFFQDHFFTENRHSNF